MRIEEIMDEYAKQNPSSKAAWQDANQVIPGGISANVKFFAPFPLYMKEGHGAYLKDVDNHEYVDYVLSYGPLILGHERKEILDSISSYFADHGTMLYGTPHTGEADFAKLLQKYYPSLESVRYTNSGTEATLLSIRTACAFTGKYKVAKFEGHYHGGFNEVLFSINPNVAMAGDEEAPKSLPESAGLSAKQQEDTIMLPFNNLEACEVLLRKYKDEVACVIMEPVFGGTIPATKEFMAGIRKITAELGIIMIIDEVKTGFRVGMTGAQGYYDVKPDLATMGKVIGAGFPVGILGGRKDIMDLAAPKGSDILDTGNKKNNAADILYHSGTYNGHPLILSIGATTISILEKELDALIERTNKMKVEIQRIFAKHGVKILTPGVGAMFNICITELDEIRTYRELQKSDFELRKKIDYALLLEGIYNKPCNRYNLSTAHDDKVIDFTLSAFEKAFERI